MFKAIFNTFTNCFKIPELKSRIIFTLAVLAICRSVALVPIPGLDGAALSSYFDQLAKQHKVPVIGISGFSPDNKLNQLSDAKIFVAAEKGDYFLVEGVHDVILHMLVRYFKDYFNHIAEKAS